MATKDEGPSLKTVERRGQKAVEKKAEALKRLTVEYVDVDTVHPNKYNPNRQDPHDFELLLRSMREDGFTQPIVVQRASREIVDGEHRWRAAREIGMKRVPIVLVDMTPEQMRISTLRHNRARGSEDGDLASQLLRDLRELGALEWAQDSLMIGDDELQKLIDDVKAPDDLAGEEFSEAWVPTKNAANLETRDASKEAVAFTPAAEKSQKAFEVKLANAKTEPERVNIEFAMRQESYRMVLVFNGDEAELVRGALEPNAAVRLLEYAKKKAAAVAGSAT